MELFHSVVALSIGKNKHSIKTDSVYQIYLREALNVFNNYYVEIP
jgi:hypothetical protein